MSNSHDEHSISPEGAAPEEPPQNQSSAFHWQRQRALPYLKEGQPLTWLQVQGLVGDLMKERGITFTSTADLQKKLPALIFSLQQEMMG